MYNNCLGLTRNTAKTNELKDRYNTLSKVFHPDKVDPAFIETSRKIFIKVLEDYQTYQNPLILSIVKLYGDEFGIELYNKYKDQFELIQAHISAEKLDMEQVLWIYKDEIEEMVEFIYYNNYANNAYWLDVSLHHEVDLEAYKGESSLSLALTRSLGSCVLGMNMAFNGSFIEKYNTELNGSFTFYTYVLKQRVTNTIRANVLNFRNIAYAAGYSLLGFNFVHELSFGEEIHNSHRIEYTFNENSMVRANAVFGPSRTNYVLTFVNKFDVTDKAKLKASLILFKQAAKLKLSAEYKFNDMFKAIVSGDIVQAFEHQMNEYYKLENSFIGFGTTIGSAKVKIGASYRYTSFKDIEIRLSYYRLHMTLPIVVGEHDMVTWGLLLAMTAAGIASYVCKTRTVNEESIKKFKNARSKIEHINSTLVPLSHADSSNNEEKASALPDLELNTKNGLLIESCYIVPISVSRMDTASLRQLKIPLIDCTSFVSSQFESENEIDFDGCLNKIDANSEYKISDITNTEELALCIYYREGRKRYRTILTKSQKTQLKRAIDVNLFSRLLEYLLR